MAASNASTSAATNAGEREVVITRVFEAPRELVFEAWTKAEHLSHWFGPNGFTVPSCEVDFRVGGVFRLCMRSPEGEDFWSKGIYREIVAPERLVFTSALMDDEDNSRFEVLTTVTFAGRDAKTMLTLHASVVEIFDPTSAASLDGMEEGWRQTLDRLEAHVARTRGEAA